MNAIAPIGHNRGPELEPFEAIKVHIEDLLVEAYNWADGVLVESPAQADAILDLIGQLKDAAKTADDQRVLENKPFDEGKAAVQAKYAPFIADPKNRNPGKVWKAIDALNAARKPYLDALEAERRRLADIARKEAEAKAAEARAALQAAQDSDLAARDAAEALVRSAAIADAQAKRAEADKVTGLRKTYTPVMADRRAALTHYASTRTDDLVAFLVGLAEADVRAGKRTIPGFEIIEGTKL